MNLMQKNGINMLMVIIQEKTIHIIFDMKFRLYVVWVISLNSAHNITAVSHRTLSAADQLGYHWTLGHELTTL